MEPVPGRKRLDGMISRFTLRALIATAVVAMLSAVPVSTALACSCAMATIPQSAEFADVVFTGTTTAVELPAPGGVAPGIAPMHYAFAVDQVFKGEVPAGELVATTAMDGASCGTSFGMEERWLVFANVQDGELWTGLCSGNILLIDPETEAAALAELGPPIGTPPSTPAETQAPFEVPVALVVGLAVAAVVVGVSAWAFLHEPGRPTG